MAVANEQALVDLHAQRAELVHQQSAVQEQAPAPEDAPAVRARGLAPRQRLRRKRLHRERAARVLRLQCTRSARRTSLQTAATRAHMPPRTAAARADYTKGSTQTMPFSEVGAQSAAAKREGGERGKLTRKQTKRPQSARGSRPNGLKADVHIR